MKETNRRNGAIEFWRFIFAALIVMRHTMFLPSYLTGQYHWVNGQSIGVEFFFIVSGFLMARSALNYEGNTGIATGKFILRKWLAILPAYLFAHLASALLYLIFQPDEFSGVFSDSLFQVLMLQITGLVDINSWLVESSWYLSAMLLAMLVLFPMLHAKRQLFLNVIVPCVTIYFMQEKCLKYGYLDTFDYSNDTFRMFPYFTRAMAMICLGCIAHNICSHITKENHNIHPTRLLKTLLTIAEFGCYLTVVVASMFIERSRWDFFAVILLAAAVTISFSGLSWSPELFSSLIFSWLGKLSLSVYLNHFMWIRVLRETNMDLTLVQELVISISLITTSSLFCMFLTETLKLLWKNNKPKIKSLLIKEKQIETS